MRIFFSVSNLGHFFPQKNLTSLQKISAFRNFFGGRQNSVSSNETQIDTYGSRY